MERAEDQTFTVTSPSVASLNKADPGANWRLEASVRAINACRSPILGKSGDSSTGIDGSCIMYVKLVLSGSRGAVAVGDSYAILPTDGRAEGRADGGPSTPAGGTGRLLLTGTTHSIRFRVLSSPQRWQLVNVLNYYSRNIVILPPLSTNTTRMYIYRRHGSRKPNRHTL